MKKKEMLSIDFGDEWESIDDQLYKSVRNILENARKKAFTAVNTAMVEAYWHVGKKIVDLQGGAERAAYGDGMIKKLSERLTTEFVNGYDERNLRHMRQFFLMFPNWNALRTELSWTHYRMILKVEKIEARDYYIRECAEGNWSTRQLERQINSFCYERILANQDEKALLNEATEKEPVKTAKDFVKDPFVLEFLGLPPNRRHSEIELEQGLIDHMQKFLLELGPGYAFKARQKRISINGSNFYIDLLFYNDILKCSVIVDLKTGKLTHKDLGQMQMYLNYFTRELMNEGDNPPMGIIICAGKNESVVRYVLPEKGDGRIFASLYKLHLPDEEELAREIAARKELLMLERPSNAERPNLRRSEHAGSAEHHAVPKYRTYLSSITDEDVERIKEYSKKLQADDRARKEFFIRVGLYDEDGNIREPFRRHFEEDRSSD